MAKDKMINSTESVKGGSVLGSTLKDMEEHDMNVLNDSGRKSGK
jgi:general stress protein YciG